MHKIAFIIADRFVYWTPIMLAFGVLAAVCMFLALHMGRTGKATGAFVAVPLAIVLSMVLGRLVYWCCMPERYGSLLQALTDFGTEGFALAGIVAGCALAACLVRLIGLCDSLPSMLDSMSLAGLFGIAVGRLNHLFNTADRGVIVASPRELVLPQPLGAEYRQPVFLLQAVATAALFVILLVFFLSVGRKKPGDTCLLACLFHGIVQMILDGARYDALLLPGIKALTLVQMVGMLLAVLSTALFSVKMVRNRGWKWWYLALWLPAAGAVSAAAVLLQQIRYKPIDGSSIHGVVFVALLIVAALTLAIRALGTTVKNRMEFI